MDVTTRLVKWSCLFTIAMAFHTSVLAQKIQYSRQNFTTPYFDVTKLVADVSGHHHVLVFTLNKKTSIHIFDEKLQLVSEKEFGYKYSNGLVDISTITFKDYYLLSIRKPFDIKRDLWKIDADGNAVDLTEKFNRLVDSLLIKPASLQLVNKNDQLFFVSASYYRDLGKMLTTVVQLNKDLSPTNTRKIVFPLKRIEQVKQLTLFGESLLVLKTSYDSTGHSLQLLKGNLNTGKLLMNDFSSGTNAHTNASFRYNADDTSILIYSLVRNTVFISKLDTALNYKAPVFLIKNQFSNKVATAFLFLPGRIQQCISMTTSADRINIISGVPSTTSSSRSQQESATTGRGTQVNLNYERFGETPEQYSARMAREENAYRPGAVQNAYLYGTANDGFNNNSGSVRYNTNYSSGIEPAFRLSVLDKQFQIIKDSVVSNVNTKTTVHLLPSANVMLNGRSYLFFTQNLTAKKRGILMAQVNSNNEVVMTDVRVDDNNEYLLPQLQLVNGRYVLMPYTHRREIGLLKITMGE